MEPNICIIVSRFNGLVTSGLLNGALRVFKKHGISIPKDNIFHVPGAMELPLMAKKIIEKRKPDAVIVCGAIIKGTTSHHLYVANESVSGSTYISMNTGVPVIQAILTTQTHSQAEARSGQSLETNKGAKAAESCLDLLDEFKRI